MIKIRQTLLLRNVTLIKQLLQQVTDGNRVLKSLQSNSLNKMVFELVFYLNINSIRNKFELLSEQVRGNVNVLVVSEAKIDYIFPIGKFLIHGFSPPYRLDHDSKDGGIMLYIREDMLSNLLAADRSL